ncbi:MAG: SnoaL-like domain-containing protein [Gemmatimonadaceae bacterium]
MACIALDAAEPTNGGQFIVEYTLDVTPNATGKRGKINETAVPTIKNGKVVHEEFFNPA